MIMLFNAPADPRDYPWRITWHAESHDESTLSFYATDFAKETIGPGIAAATYGGAMFLFPRGRSATSGVTAVSISPTRSKNA